MKLVLKALRTSEAWVEKWCHTEQYKSDEALVSLQKSRRHSSFIAKQNQACFVKNTDL